MARARPRIPATTCFIGREEELARLRGVFEDGARLISLVGAGGIGKTRLAEEWLARDAELLDRRLSGGVVQCSVATARNSVDLHRALGQELGVVLPEADDVGDEVLGRALCGLGPALVLLDNVEQIIEETAEALTLWLRAAPATRFLVTSREVLRIDEEVVVEVPPLSLEGGPRSEAARLFVERSRLAGVDLEVRTAARTIERIAKTLDGLPLAIELAAARVRLIEPEELLRRLVRRFDILVRGSRSAPSRHQTLRHTMEWSWELLEEAERVVLSRCSIFVGAFDLAAAEAIVAADDSERDCIVERLEALRDKSLLTVRHELEPPRFQLLETVRAFGLEHLSDVEDTRDRHARHYCTTCSELASLVEGDGDGDAVVDRLDLEQTDLVRALEWALAEDRGETTLLAVEALADLERVLAAREPAVIYKKLLDAALALFDDHPRRGDWLCARASVNKRLGHSHDAEEDARAAITVARDAHRSSLEAKALAVLADLHYFQGRDESARELLEAALATLKPEDDQVLTAHVRTDLGTHLHMRGDLEGARTHYEASLAIHRSRSDAANATRTLARLGFLHQDGGDLDEARQCYDEALERSRAWGDLAAQGRALGFLGNLERQRGDLEGARQRYMSALDSLRRAGDQDYEAVFLMDLGILLVDHEQWSDARRALEEALDAFGRSPSARCEALTWGYMAVSALALGDLDTGVGQLRHADQLARGCGQHITATLSLHRGHADLLVDGDIEAARGRLDLETGVRSQHVVIAARVLLRAIERHSPPIDALVVDDEGRAFSPPGCAESIDLSTREPLQRLLLALARARRDRPGELVTRSALIEAGWPAETIERRAAGNRLRVALSTLRKKGLEGLIMSEGGGYRFDESSHLVFSRLL